MWNWWRDLRGNVLTPKGAERRRLAGEHVRSDIAVHAARVLLGKPGPERQAEVGGRLEFDACKRTVAGRGARGQRRNRAADAVAVFQRVETGKERHGQTARGLGVVT